jgi:hypothetical protein
LSLFFIRSIRCDGSFFSLHTAFWYNVPVVNLAAGV